MTQTDLLYYIEELENFYNKAFITLEDYYRIKSNIIDKFFEERKGE